MGDLTLSIETKTAKYSFSPSQQSVHQPQTQESVISERSKDHPESSQVIVAAETQRIPKASMAVTSAGRG